MLMGRSQKSSFVMDAIRLEVFFFVIANMHVFWI